VKFYTENIEIQTIGHNQILDITSKVNEVILKLNVQDGLINIFVVGSTAGITTIEYEPGLLKDLPESFEKFAPTGKHYNHDKTWGDGNGYAHVRAALLGASLTIPINDGLMCLGTWQQVVLVDFDNRERERKLICKIIGQ
jgi:secondary thiamine-phosphate synthase enzyme